MYWFTHEERQAPRITRIRRIKTNEDRRQRRRDRPFFVLIRSDSSYSCYSWWKLLFPTRPSLVISTPARWGSVTATYDAETTSATRRTHDSLPVCRALRETRHYPTSSGGGTQPGGPKRLLGRPLRRVLRR